MTKKVISCWISKVKTQKRMGWSKSDNRRENDSPEYQAKENEFESLRKNERHA
jgi:hypothetical protein